VIFTASILGDYEELSWNFGQDATPQTASGIGPVSVSYSSVGPKTVFLTLLNEGANFIESKEDFIVGRTCVREPFPGTPIAIPGIVKAVDFDKGGQDVAYNDSDVEN
jgi:PKD repeat protein